MQIGALMMTYITSCVLRTIMAKEVLLSRVLNATVLNGKSGDADICNTFTEYFQSIYKPNISDADSQ